MALKLRTPQKVHRGTKAQLGTGASPFAVMKAWQSVTQRYLLEVDGQSERTVYQDQLGSWMPFLSGLRWLVFPNVTFSVRAFLDEKRSMNIFGSSKTLALTRRRRSVDHRS